MENLAKYLKKRMWEKGHLNPYGYVVMAETAIPIDAMEYIDVKEIGLNDEEKEAVCSFDKMRKLHKRIEGQTNDALRTAGLKIVSKGLKKLLPEVNVEGLTDQPDWKKVRVFTNEPRHLLRSTPPSTADIITAQRLGILAVDNALAGYTDCMVSQWLTEYVLVPLELVVLGRKRIPQTGIFWKQILAKTGQPSKLDE
jgi:6-phosphofructokinase